jgi:hypothetical protein
MIYCFGLSRKIKPKLLVRDWFVDTLTNLYQIETLFSDEISENAFVYDEELIALTETIVAQRYLRYQANIHHKGRMEKFEISGFLGCSENES